ncbi:hypothetical protein AAF712_007644 [Marasmius tenuissimus]|uniref:3'-5' exonuclease domain-containing protein n=1 Tax=Marasmius tenuissimus TaxID=585030 RepID=A0ABR2ZUE3_9AGAR|nr:hypothetical protein PM082_024653 [Marasmius tenuissimus]
MMDEESSPMPITSLANDLQNVSISTAQNDSIDLTLPDDVFVCDTEEGLTKAISELRTYHTLILDCEGEELGAQGGALSIISIRGVYSTSSSPPKTFLFDLVNLVPLGEPSTLLGPLFDLLSSTTTRKVVYDGRMDFCAIWFGYGATLNNVVDLQVAEVQRKMRTESVEARMRHLGRFFSPKATQAPSKREKYIHIHPLTGLGACLMANELAEKPKDTVDHHSWMIRPLSEAHLFYAAQDVYLINLLLSHFESQNLIDENLVHQSLRYVTIWKDEQRDKDDHFRSNPFFPLEILEYNPAVPRRPCDGCGRRFGQKSFPSNTWGSNHGRRFCHVCSIVPNWQQRKEFFEDLKKRKKEEKEREQEKGKEKTEEKETTVPSASSEPGAAPPTGDTNLLARPTGTAGRGSRANVLRGGGPIFVRGRGRVGAASLRRGMTEAMREETRKTESIPVYPRGRLAPTASFTRGGTGSRARGGNTLSVPVRGRGATPSRGNAVIGQAPAIAPQTTEVSRADDRSKRSAWSRGRASVSRGKPITRGGAPQTVPAATQITGDSEPRVSGGAGGSALPRRGNRGRGQGV